MKIASEIENLVPYEPGKPIEETKREYGLDKVCKLASNENALGPSQKVLNAIKEALPHLHRYPDASSYNLTKKLAAKLGVSEKSIIFTNGSNEAIDLVIRLFCQPGDKILTSEKAFIAYKICAQASRVATTEVPMKDGFQIDLASFQKHWTSQHKVIFIPNPNNPTGTYFNKQEWELFLANFGNREDVVIVLDEAYTEFVRAKDYPNGLSYLDKVSNLILSRTLSKVYGLAGLRVGYMLGAEKWINYLHRIRTPFNINKLAQIAAETAIEDEDYIKRSQDLVWTGLDYFYQKLDQLNLKYYPSQANFVLFETPEKGADFSTKLLQRGVILRPLAAYGLENHLRMSVGLQAENELAIKNIGEILTNR